MPTKFLTLLLLLLLAACNHLDVTDDEETGSGTNTEQPATNNASDALSAADILSGTHEDEIVWVEGYIVGYASGSSLSTAVFGLPDDAANTNFLLADTPDEDDAASVVPVELPKGAKRDALNLYDHPELLGQRIRLEAYATTYFRVPGLKRLYAYEILDENSGGNDTPSSGGISLPIDHEEVFNGEGR